MEAKVERQRCDDGMVEVGVKDETFAPSSAEDIIKSQPLNPFNVLEFQALSFRTE